ncbi:MAG: YidB family protein [Pseudorhizobium sp.]
MVSGPMKALLGVLAVAGFQNRDKISELLRGLQNPQQGGPDGKASGGIGDVLGGLAGRAGGKGGFGDLLRGGSAGGLLGGGIGDLLKQFQQNGHGEKASTWVKDGPNAEISDHELSQALGPDVLQDLSQRTGLTPEEILSRLSRDLPKAVDELTPGGAVLDEDDREVDVRQFNASRSDNI